MTNITEIVQRSLEEAKAQVDKAQQRLSELEGAVNEKVASLEQDVKELEDLKTKLNPVETQSAESDNPQSPAQVGVEGDPNAPSGASEPAPQ